MAKFTVRCRDTEQHDFVMAILPPDVTASVEGHIVTIEGKIRVLSGLQQRIDYDYPGTVFEDGEPVAITPDWDLELRGLNRNP